MAAAAGRRRCSLTRRGSVTTDVSCTCQDQQGTNESPESSAERAVTGVDAGAAGASSARAHRRCCCCCCCRRRHCCCCCCWLAGWSQTPCSGAPRVAWSRRSGLDTLNDEDLQAKKHTISVAALELPRAAPGGRRQQRRKQPLPAPFQCAVGAAGSGSHSCQSRHQPRGSRRRATQSRFNAGKRCPAARCGSMWARRLYAAHIDAISCTDGDETSRASSGRAKTVAAISSDDEKPAGRASTPATTREALPATKSQVPMSTCVRRARLKGGVRGWGS